MSTVNNRGLLFGDSASGSTERLLAALRRSVLFEALKVGLRLGNKAKGLYQQQVEHHGAN